jgi:membrane-bound ClpP family serine protease
MLLWIAIITLLSLGLVLILLEVIFIPGTTVVGLLGLVCSIAGIVICYEKLGSDVGLYALAGICVITGLALYYSFRAKVWTRFSLKGSITSRVNDGSVSEVHVGDEGRAISALRPGGKAEFHHTQLEVRSFGNYVEGGTRIRVREIGHNQIIVEPIN